LDCGLNDWVANADGAAPLPTPTRSLPVPSDDIEGDQRLPHNSGQSVDFETLAKLGCLAYPSIGLNQVEQM